MKLHYYVHQTHLYDMTVSLYSYDSYTTRCDMYSGISTSFTHETTDASIKIIVMRPKTAIHAAAAIRLEWLLPVPIP